MNQTRVVVKQALYGGKCVGSSTNSTSCVGTSCPADCVLSGWSDWSTCTVPCGGGKQYSTRTIVQGAVFGGRCTNILQQEQDCNTDPCPSSGENAPSTPWNDNIDNLHSGDGVPTGAIVGAVIGAFAAALIVGGIIAYAASSGGGSAGVPAPYQGI